jgi:DNA recombination protein RmuC
MDELGRECAQLTERASRLAVVEKLKLDLEHAADAVKSELAKYRESNGRLAGDIEAKKQRLSEVEQDCQRLSTERDSLMNDQIGLKSKIAELNTTLEQERRQVEEKLALLSNAREELSNQFKTLASEILEEKSKKFTEQNQTNLAQLLDPLKEKITAFQSKVEEVYVQEGKDRTALGEQVKMLTELNATLSKEAQNLTLALKGDRKAQGTWGEIILEDVLEKAGLLRGQHFEVQGSIKSEDGQSHVIPDVVIHLPADRHLVVDSKMTLPDYRTFADAATDEERTDALKRHLVSIRSHMKGLSEKNYQSLYGLNSLDFVVMFVPLEPAFMLAVTNDRELFQQGWDKNVLLVSPSTLLFVVRTVAFLWRQEDLSRNAKDISNRGAELYDKLVGFVDDLQQVGKRIQQAQDGYNEARRKLSEGKGNLIRQAEMLKTLGVTPSKTLPTQWTDSANAEPIALIGNDAGGPNSAIRTVDSGASRTPA